MCKKGGVDFIINTEAAASNFSRQDSGLTSLVMVARLLGVPAN